MDYTYTDGELVIGLIGAVGTDLNAVSSHINDRIKRYGYKTNVISVSESIIKDFKDKSSEPENEYTRISEYMDIGNELRRATDCKAIALGIASKIRSKRSSTNTILEKTAHIIRSLKHPNEVKLLRSIYGNGFYLIGVYCEKALRKKNLEDKGLKSEQADELISRDENEKEISGQRTRDTFELSDFFIGFDEVTTKYKASINRLLDLIFGDPFITPTIDEFGMFMAFSASLRSADLSRQIGASIVKSKEIISMGANDCPAYGGGLYWPEMDKTYEYKDLPYGRDYKTGYDTNKSTQYEMMIDILTNLGLEITEDNIKKLKNSSVGDLTEYGRMVHAEMEALLMCARNSISCRDATLYCTTFPCHNCAKHIIAAGIRRVVYIEPYPKSRAIDFYSKDSISTEKDAEKVSFEPFIGVGPRKFVTIFSMTNSNMSDRIRKDRNEPNGKVIKWNMETARIRDQLIPTSYIDREIGATIEYNNYFERWMNDNGKDNESSE